MSDSWPFTVHKNDRFPKLIDQLCKVGIAEVMKPSDKTTQLKLKDIESFLEIFKIVFLLYATPNDKHIKFKNGTLVIKGQFIELALMNCISSTSQEILDVLITEDDDPVYEEAFNALIAVYIGSLKPLEFIFPNTYIIQLGKHTHEFDIFCGFQYPNCIAIETTRGFSKKDDNTEESYAWHFKKAVFRKWMIEKLYSVKCQLWYITLQGQSQKDALQDTLPDELEEEKKTLQSKNELLKTVLKYEKDNIQIIDLGKFRNTLSIQKIGNLLNTNLFDKLAKIRSSDKT
jgi:hypothetical protein